MNTWTTRSIIQTTSQCSPTGVGHAVERRTGTADWATWKLDAMTTTQKGNKAARLAYTLLRAYFGLVSPKGSGRPMDSDFAEVPAASFPDGRRCDRVLNALLIRYFLNTP